MLTYQRVERQMAVSFHRRDQVRQDRFEAFPTDAIRGLPKDNERLADRPRIDPPSQSGASEMTGWALVTSRIACLRWQRATATNSSNIFDFSDFDACI